MICYMGSKNSKSEIFPPNFPDLLKWRVIIPALKFSTVFTIKIFVTTPAQIEVCVLYLFFCIFFVYFFLTENVSPNHKFFCLISPASFEVEEIRWQVQGPTYESSVTVCTKFALLHNENILRKSTFNKPFKSVFT